MASIIATRTTTAARRLRSLAWSGLLAIAATGCSDTECDALQPLIEPSTASAPGTLQAAFVESDQAHGAVAVRSDGAVLCFLCNRVVKLDGNMHETGQFAVDDVVRVAVAPDDAIYFLRPGAARSTSELVALSPDGEPRWKMTVDGLPESLELVAGREGPYVGLTSAAAQPTGIIGFDAATGAQRTLLTGGATLLGAANGGVIVTEPTGVDVTTIRQLDAAGAAVWSHPSTMRRGSPGFGGAVGTADGGAIVFADIASDVDFGDLSLDADTGKSVVAGFSATGATLWAFAVSDYWITHVALAAHGEILLGGQVGGSYPTPADSFLAVGSPAGIARTLPIEGREDQVLEAIAPDADGAVWLQVTSREGDDNRPTPALQVADHTFEGTGNYVLKLVP